MLLLYFLSRENISFLAKTDFYKSIGALFGRNAVPDMHPVPVEIQAHGVGVGAGAETGAEGVKPPCVLPALFKKQDGGAPEGDLFVAVGLQHRLFPFFGQVAGSGQGQLERVQRPPLLPLLGHALHGGHGCQRQGLFFVHL